MSLSQKEARILSDLSFRNKGIFTLEDFREYVEKPKDILYNLIEKKWILRIKQGVFLIAPLTAGELGADSFTVHTFVIASHLVQPYYISHWSALNYHGFSEQTPSSVYVSSTKPRNKKRILDTNFIFVTLSKHKMFGAMDIEIESKPIKISTPEKTIVDCLDHPEHCGGIEEVAKAIYFEQDQLDFLKILNFSKRMKNKTIIKRLGYLIDLLHITEQASILDFEALSKGYSKLDPKSPIKGKFNEKWKLHINVNINQDQWMI